MIQLGQKVRDVVSGFEGIAIARTEWLNGCVRVTVAPRVKKGGEIIEAVTFDAEQLEIRSEEPIRLPVPPFIRGLEAPRGIRYVQTGGDRPDPPRRKDPTR